jgi:hypothetical protein
MARVGFPERAPPMRVYELGRPRDIEKAG